MKLSNIYYALIVSFVVLLAACTPKANLSSSEAKLPTAEEITAKFSAAQLDQGMAIFQQSCVKCHKLREPQKYTIPKWNRVLNRMIPKAKLGAEDAELVRAYVFANAKLENKKK